MRPSINDTINLNQNFIKTVLSWSVELVKQKIDLSENPEKTMPRSFLLPLLEETRHSISEGIQENAKLPNQKFSLQLKGNTYKSGRNGNNIQAYSKNTPAEIGHSYNLLLIELNDKEKSINFFAFAQKKEDKNLNLLLSNPDIEELRDKNTTVQATYLCNLASYNRMYTGCQIERTSKLIEQIQSQKITSKFERKSGINADDLNTEQQLVIDQYLFSPSGIKLVQGPPGTGKTRTVVSIIEKIFSLEEKAMVCGPSNRSIEEIALRLLTKNPNAPCILISSNPNLPAELKPYSLYAIPGIILNQIQNIRSYADKIREKKSFDPTIALNEFKVLKEFLQNLQTRYTLLEESEWNSIAGNLGKLNMIQYYLEGLTSQDPEKTNMFEKVNLSEKIDPINQIYAYLEDVENALDLNNKEKLYGKILNNSSIIFSTLSNCADNVLEKLIVMPSKLIVDEASQALTPDLFLLLNLHASKSLLEANLMLIGDHRQLPPTVLSQRAKDSLGKSIFEQFIKNKSVYVTLTQQYRMHPEISRFPNKVFYNGELKDPVAPTAIKNTENNFLTNPFCMIDIHDGKEEFDKISKSYYNMTEVWAILDIIRYLKKSHPTLDLGIITPYTEQVKRIMMNLEKFNLKAGVSVSTIDGFQGAEKRMIILSTVRANGLKDLGFFDDANRINVALTRAIDQLIIVSRFATLQCSQIFNELIEDTKARNLIFTKSDLEKLIPYEPKAASAKNNAPFFKPAKTHPKDSRKPAPQNSLTK